MKTAINAGDQNQSVLRICRELLVRLKRKVDVVRMYAYGSRVRGDFVLGSDLDLVVELRDFSLKNKHTVHDVAWEIGMEEGVVISVIVVSEELFEHGLVSNLPFACNVKREGIEIAA